MLKSDFYINYAKFQEYFDKATDWLINSWKFETGSDEWQICRLKQKMYKKEAIKHLMLARKELPCQA